MKVLVTGADGFIGQHTLPKLLSAGFEVHALYWQNQPKPIGGVHWHRVDLLQTDEMEASLAGIQASHLLHLAWYTEHGKFWHAEENLLWVACSLHLLKSFVAYGGQRIVMAGSCAEYDWSAGHCSERKTPCRPSTLYGTTKHALHQIVEAYCNQHNISFAWGRIFFLYGPGEAIGRFVPAVINGLLRQEEVPCSDGSQTRDFMYVKDVASAFVALLESGLDGAVNIASGDSCTLKKIGEEIMRQIGGGGKICFGALPNRQSEPSILTANARRLREDLGWQPEYTLEAGLAESINWWRRKQGKDHAC